MREIRTSGSVGGAGAVEPTRATKSARGSRRPCIRSYPTLLEPRSGDKRLALVDAHVRRRREVQRDARGVESSSGLVMPYHPAAAQSDRSVL